MSILTTTKKVEYLRNFELFENEADETIENQQQQKQQQEQHRKDELDETMVMETSRPQMEAVSMKEEERKEEADEEAPSAKVDGDMTANEESKEQTTVEKQSTRIFINLSINQEPKLKILKEIEDVVEKFEEELRSRDAVCEPTSSENDGSIRIVCTRQFDQVDDMTVAVSQWQNNVLRFLTEFFKYEIYNHFHPSCKAVVNHVKKVS